MDNERIPKSIPENSFVSEGSVVGGKVKYGSRGEPLKVVPNRGIATSRPAKHNNRNNVLMLL